MTSDTDGDGLWDVVVCYDGGARMFINVGGKGNPEFRRLGEKDGNDDNADKVWLVMFAKG